MTSPCPASEQQAQNTHDTRVLLSPALSSSSDAELPIIPTNDSGMIADDEASPENQSAQSAIGTAKAKKTSTKPRRTITYVSRHFVAESDLDGAGSPVPPKRSRRAQKQPNTAKVKRTQPDQRHDADQDQGAPTLATPPVTPARPGPRPRIYHGLNFDDLSSDSSLTDVPDDIGPDPFSPEEPRSSPSESPSLSTIQGIDVTTKSRKGQRRPTKSPYFPHPHKHRPTFLSTLPFPPLSHATFGLMQERLAHDPFRLLIATIFLNKTPGERAMPVFYQLMSRFPTPSDLARADTSEITSIIYGLGFQNQRAKKCVAMAKTWVNNPPERGKRYRKLHYPNKGDGRDVRDDEVLDDQDTRVAWEISHLPGLGPYSHDSWRIFCRDELRGVADKRNVEGEGHSLAKERGAEENEEEGAASSSPSPGTGTATATTTATATFEPEWKRVVPFDKELRAYLTWMWMKEGWVWNKETGQRTKAPEELMAKARGGGIVVEERDSAHLVVKTVEAHDLDHLQEGRKVERTAGDFLPQDLDTSAGRTTPSL
ncbi:hypothetical protein A1O3_08647 [Capronia epimyces CBS 606.96]|uniref:HhH-GPD domain-containing protein n=1 Tax=Capronia epimyces CBS 606.96 TaxID=1182542 RepID=W9XQ83_9EURO|nr:uncharacterized protein A1O3_08647 [Capronia epimyces CBS 606.96]EXJ79146.1 hypothetical protein A1O3_08647 [Capronia epimyces CBS 606.96]